MLRWLMRRLAARHRCRNTRLGFTVEKAPGCQPQVIVQLLDKCTGATYEAAFTVATARNIEVVFAEAIRSAEQLTG